MKAIIQALLFCALALSQYGCSSEPKQQDTAPMTWEETLAAAKGQTVTMMMWQGDPLINAYMKDFVVPALREQYGIQLNIVQGQGNNIVNLLMAELEAGKPKSEIDMMWINGETFFQLRQVKGLYGPFVEQLPNSQYIDWDNPFIAKDFQQPIDGFECPWGNVQMSLIYNSEKVPSPPQNMQELAAWAKANPGKFTFATEFTGMTLLKAWLNELAGGGTALQGDFDEAKYAKFSTQLWDFLNETKPYFWNNGETFPATLAQLHQLFANGELYFTMSNNDAEVDNKVAQGIFPPSSRAYVPKGGTIQNSHYLGIAKMSDHKAAAMVAINFLISPEAQFHKMQPAVWGDGTILSREKLPADWQAKFSNIPGRQYAPDRAAIQPYAIMEPAPEYMIRLFEDFKKQVIEH